jgi:peptidoglycan/xylan/chitin deacetylase (PgdA/CDA1 family)
MAIWPASFSAPPAGESMSESTTTPIFLFGSLRGMTRMLPDRPDERPATPMTQQVLCYHALSETWPATLSVTPRRFADQLRYLRRRGYRGVTFTDAVRLGSSERVVAVTFDDAYRSVLEIGRPVLDELGWPATVFVPTLFPDAGGPMSWEGIDQWLGGPHEGEMHCLSWEELRTLADAGWEIGSHTRSHPHLTRLGDDELRDELGRSREECEAALGRGCTSIAYPYGDFDARVADAAGAAGYECAATLSASLASPTPLTWPRTGVYHGDATWRWRMKLSPQVVRARASRVGAAVDRARGV